MWRFNTFKSVVSAFLLISKKLKKMRPICTIATCLPTAAPTFATNCAIPQEPILQFCPHKLLIVRCDAAVAGLGVDSALNAFVGLNPSLTDAAYLTNLNTLLGSGAITATPPITEKSFKTETTYASKSVDCKTNYKYADKTTGSFSITNARFYRPTTGVGSGSAQNVSYSFSEFTRWVSLNKERLSLLGAVDCKGRVAFFGDISKQLLSIYYSPIVTLNPEGLVSDDDCVMSRTFSFEGAPFEIIPTLFDFGSITNVATLYPNIYNLIL